MKNRRARFYKVFYRSFYAFGVILLLTGMFLSIVSSPAEAGFRGIQITSTSRPKNQVVVPEVGQKQAPAGQDSASGGSTQGGLPRGGEISVRFTTGDTALCQLTPEEIDATAVVTLPEDVEVILQMAFRVVNPPDLRTENEYSRSAVKNGDQVTLSGQWPGVRPGDNVVEIHFGAILLAPSGNPISEGTGLDFFWYPYVCAPPTDGTPGTGTAIATLTHTATNTVTPTQPTVVDPPTNTPTHTITPTRPAFTNTPTNTMTATQPGLTQTPTNTVSATAPAQTNTATNTVTATQASGTNTPTHTTTSTATMQASLTITPSVTVTLTPTSPPPTAQVVPSSTLTNTATATQTATQTHTPTGTSTSTVTLTATATRTVTSTATPTATEAVSTSTASPTPPPTITNTVGVLPTVVVLTAIPSSTLTITPSPTNTVGVPITGGAATSTPPPTITVGIPVTGGAAATSTPIITSAPPQATRSGTAQVVPVTGAGITQPTAIPITSILFWQRLTTYLGLLMLGLAAVLHGMDRRQ